MAAALIGQPKAYEELLRHYCTAVYYLILKFVPQADDAEDVTIGTFGKAFRHLWRLRSAPDCSALYIRQQRCERVRAAVAKLPAKYVGLVRPRYFEELSYEEMAMELQLPLGKVKAHLNRA